MSPRRIAWVALAALAGLAPLQPAPAFPVTSCGGVWVGPVAECTFDFAGFPITIDGVAFADPIASIGVTLTAEPRDVPLAPPILLMACGAIRQDNAGCHDSQGPSELTERELLGIVRLTCKVYGSERGTYTCTSGFTTVG